MREVRLMKKRRNPLGQFVIGMIMLASGLYWFLSNVTVSTYFGLRFMGIRFGGGLIVIPFIASIISNMQFIFRSTSLYVYLLMLILIFGGGALVGQVLFQWPKDDGEKKK